MTQQPNNVSAAGVLQPCPFCGGKAVLNALGTHASCSKCTFLPQLFISEWNRRAAASAQATAPIYQLKLGSGDWRDQDESAYRYNVKHCPADVRIVYAAPSPAALESAEKEAVPVAWQPIETAPQTGRTLLLGYLNAAGKWRTVRGQWMSEAYIAESWEEPDDVEPGWFETSVEADWPPNCWRIKPTHWMPLPAAPAALSQKVGDQK